MSCRQLTYHEHLITAGDPAAFVAIIISGELQASRLISPWQP